MMALTVQAVRLKLATCRYLARRAVLRLTGLFCAWMVNAAGPGSLQIQAAD